MDAFRPLLLTISYKLKEEEVSGLKSLCNGKIPEKKLEFIQSGHELFDILLEMQMITSGNTSFLEYLLKHIEREDLVSLVQQSVEEGEFNTPEEERDANEQRRLRTATKVICDNVGGEWKRLVRELGLSEVKIQRIVGAHPFDMREQLFQSLEEWQNWKGKDAKANDLIKALRVCHLNLTADLVEQELLKLKS